MPTYQYRCEKCGKGSSAPKPSPSMKRGNPSVQSVEAGRSFVPGRIFVVTSKKT
jgi:hypothetical protein